VPAASLLRDNLQAHLAFARVDEQPPSSMPTSLPVRTNLNSAEQLADADLCLGEAVSNDDWDALASHARNRLQSDRDDRCQDSRRHFPFVAGAATSSRLLLKAWTSHVDPPDDAPHAGGRPAHDRICPQPARRPAIGMATYVRLEVSKPVIAGLRRD
jgi:hypothetical protein